MYNIKISKAILTLRDIKFKQQRFYKSKLLIYIKNADVDKKLISNKIFINRYLKYFIGYKDGTVMQLFIKLSEMLRDRIIVS